MVKQLHRRLEKGFVEEVLRSFNKREMSESQACELLGLKRTRLYELRKEWLKAESKGDFKLSRHKSYVTRALPEEVVEFLHRELRYIRQEADTFRGRFNFAFLAEEAEKRFGYRFHRNTIRRFALRHGYYHGQPEEKAKTCVRFEMAGPGMLFQHDSSNHCWIPKTGRRQDLILTKDDYSRKLVGGLLVSKETSWDHLCVVKKTIQEVGLAQAYYVDSDSIFRFSQHDGIHVTYILKKDQGDVQFRRVLEALGIGIIYAGDAQAKGKIEKVFDYFQRRLPLLCERHKVTDLEEANRLLEELILYYNERRKHEETGEIPSRRWERAVVERKSRIRPLGDGLDLERIFSLHYQRLVRKDGRISFEGKLWNSGALPGAKVDVCLIPGKSFMIYRGSQKLWEYHL